MEGRATKSQGRGQGLAARLAASGTSALSDRSSGPSSPATPLDESSSVFSRLGPMPAPTSQASSDQVGCRQLLSETLSQTQNLLQDCYLTNIDSHPRAQASGFTTYIRYCML